MKTWIIKRDGKILNVAESINDEKPPFGTGWEEVDNDWRGRKGDPLEWYDATMHRIIDDELVRRGIRKNNKGTVYNINDRTSRQIYDLDEDLRDDETKEEPLQNEAYQYYDKQKKKWVIDTVKKVKAENDGKIAEKQAAIEDAERRIQRSVRAKLSGIATKEDEEYFLKINTEIEKLREDKKQLSA